MAASPPSPSRTRSRVSHFIRDAELGNEFVKVKQTALIDKTENLNDPPCVNYNQIFPIRDSEGTVLPAVICGPI